MSLSNRWNRLDAPRWMGRLLVLQTAVFAVLALISLMSGLFVWALVLLVVAFLLGGLTSAWNAERRWAWHVLCALQVLDLLGPLAGAGGRSLLSTALLLLLPLTSLALLLHPATRTRLEPPAPRAPTRSHSPSAPPQR